MAKALNPKEWSFITLSIVLVILMSLTTLWFFNYDFPGEKQATLTGLIKIFFRELLVVVGMVFFLVYLLIEKLKIIIVSRKNKNA